MPRSPLPTPVVKTEVQEFEFPWGYAWVDAAHESWVREQGYLDDCQLPPCEGRSRFTSTRRRVNCYRDDGPGGCRIYEKHLSEVRRRDRAALRRLGADDRHSLLHHEWKMLHVAKRAGFRVPTPYALIERHEKGAAQGGTLILEDLGGIPLQDLALEIPDWNLHEKQLLATDVGTTLASLHNAGILFPTAFAKHLYRFEDGPERIGFLDLAEAHLMTGPPTVRQRAQDLAALAATMPPFAANRVLRRCALASYVSSSTAADMPNTRSLWDATSKRVKSLHERRRYRVFSSRHRPPAEFEEHYPDGEIRIRRAGAAASSTAEGQDSTLGGNPKRIRQAWKLLLALRRFGIPSPAPRSLLPDGSQLSMIVSDAGADSSPPTLPYEELVERLLQAGCAPRLGFARSLRCIAGQVRITLDSLELIERPERWKSRHDRSARKQYDRQWHERRVESSS